VASTAKSSFPVTCVVGARRSPATDGHLPYIDPVLRTITRPVVLIPIIVVVLLAAAGTWFWVRAGQSTEITTGAALAQYGAPGGRTVAGPQAGVWTYDAHGSETVGLGPVKVTRDLPPEARMVVRPAGSGYWRSLAFSEEHVERTRLAVSDAGTRAVERSTKVTVSGLGRTDSVDLVPPPLIYPRAIAVGDQWRQRYVLRDLHVDARVRVTSHDVVVVNGTRVPVVVIRTSGEITGPTPGHRDDTEWYAPSLGLPVRLVITMTVSGTASLRMSADLTLTSTEPVN
jgi:hypothetical protein